MLQWTYVVSGRSDGGEMVARTGDAEHGRGTGTTPLEERVRRLEKDVEELREQVRTHAAQGRKCPGNGTARRAVPGWAAARYVVGGESWRRPTSRGGVLPLADGRRARMAHASRARGGRRGHWRRSLCLRAACQNLPSRLLAIARGRRCRGVLPFRLRRVELVATRALRGGICLLRAHHRVR